MIAKTGRMVGSREMIQKQQLHLVILQAFVIADSLSILTILPLCYHGSDSDSSFRLGLKVSNEIIPGGLVAVENINKDLRHQLSISLKVIHVGECSGNVLQSDPQELLLKFVNSTFYQDKNISGVIELCHGTVSTAFDLSHANTSKTALSGLISTQNSRKLILSQVVSA